MMMNFYFSIASGSSGNCAVWSCDGTTVLIDLGVSVRALNTALRQIDLEITDLDAVLLTHEHTDHIKGLTTFVKKYDVPIYATFGTASAILLRQPQTQKNFRTFAAGDSFSIGALHIQSIPIPHDAAEPTAYRLDGSECLGYATDIGYLTEQLRNAMSGCETLVLESNHDVEMLKNGVYPMYLKQRIRGQYGHLSNEECAMGAVEWARKGTKRFILSHLSDKNNTPLTALRCTQRMVERNGCEVYVAPRSAMEQPLTIQKEEPQCSLFD